MIQVGDIFEDCDYHPVFATLVDYGGDDIVGVSLFTGGNRSCSPRHCAPRLLRREEILFKLERKDKWLEAKRVWLDSGYEDRSKFDALLTEEYETFGEA